MERGYTRKQEEGGKELRKIVEGAPKEAKKKVVRRRKGGTRKQEKHSMEKIEEIEKHRK